MTKRHCLHGRERPISWALYLYGLCCFNLGWFFFKVLADRVKRYWVLLLNCSIVGTEIVKSSKRFQSTAVGGKMTLCNLYHAPVIFLKHYNLFVVYISIMLYTIWIWPLFCLGFFFRFFLALLMCFGGLQKKVLRLLYGWYILVPDIIGRIVI